MVLKDFKEITEKVKASSGEKRLVVVAADDQHTVEAVMRAVDADIVVPTFIGEEEAIKYELARLGADPEAYTIINETDLEKAAALGVQYCAEGKADLMMKGKLHTAMLLRAVLKPGSGLTRPNGAMCHLSVNTCPRYHKFLVITDSGLNVRPNFNMRLASLVNAVNVLRSLGYDNPKVAVLASSELEDPKIQEAMDAVAFRNMNREGKIKNCVVDGPVALDLAVSKRCAAVKGYKSPIAGDADIVLCPDIFSGNAIMKAMVELAGGKMAGIVAGAKVPIVVTSRGSSTEEKFNTIVLATAVALGTKEYGIEDEQVADLSGLAFW